jgi:hypothetical protein
VQEHCGTAIGKRRSLIQHLSRGERVGAGRRDGQRVTDSSNRLAALVANEPCDIERDRVRRRRDGEMVRASLSGQRLSKDFVSSWRFYGANPLGTVAR